MPSSFGKPCKKHLEMLKGLEQLRLYLIQQIEVTIKTIEQDHNNKMLKGSLLAFNDILYKVEQTIKKIKQDEKENHEEVKVGYMEKPQ